MKSGGGKGKGAAFERDVCRRLSLWLSDGRDGNLLWRSAMSGGRATIQFNTISRQGIAAASSYNEHNAYLHRESLNRAQSGDVSAVGLGAYEFCARTYVEIKFYRDLSIARGFLCQTGTLVGFWDVALREAERYGKRPLLVARQNLYPTMAITDDDSAERIFDDDPIIELSRWCARVYLFDRVTAVRTRLVRRAS